MKCTILILQLVNPFYVAVNTEDKNVTSEARNLDFAADNSFLGCCEY